MSFKLPKLRPLPEQDESELTAQHGLEIQQMLPILGPLFGMAVISFSVWDYLIDPANALLALPIRIVLVLIGAIGLPADATALDAGAALRLHLLHACQRYRHLRVSC